MLARCPQGITVAAGQGTGPLTVSEAPIKDYHFFRSQMKTTSKGLLLFAALSAILLLTAMPSSAQVYCGATSYSKTCHLFMFFPQNSSNSRGPSTLSEWANAESNSLISAAISIACANSPHLNTTPDKCSASSNESVSVGTIPVAGTTTWVINYCFTSVDDSLFTVANLMVGDGTNETFLQFFGPNSDVSGCGFFDWTLDSNRQLTAALQLEASGTATLTVSLSLAP